MFLAQDALARRARQLASPAEPLPAPLRVDVSTGGGSATVTAGTCSSDEVAGQSPEAKALFYARGDLPLLAFALDGAEIETDSPLATSQLTEEFKAHQHHFS